MFKADPIFRIEMAKWLFQVAVFLLEDLHRKAEPFLDDRSDHIFELKQSLIAIFATLEKNLKRVGGRNERWQ